MGTYYDAENMSIVLKYGAAEQEEIKGLEKIEINKLSEVDIEQFRKSLQTESKLVSFEATFNTGCSGIKRFVEPFKPEDREIKFYINSIINNGDCAIMNCNVNGADLDCSFYNAGDKILNAFCKCMWSKEPFIMEL